ncbi:hypothetical protein HBI62_070710 [Parastagonospora nodorum]|nr:hypothetical protein HBH47_149820 [Parastagonospora nodorum]KAH5232325.1 hypothetical protein HBI62_070710 [Parastagonospora nodorum]KAH6163255.1 hypothetical protein HBI63_037680 [Parastagonospora nodorum]KAH6183586.1 hypothetical protein HBI61_070830 [Parastagonospora nodorum]
MASILTVASLLILASGVAYTFSRYLWRKDVRPLPPGPKGIPFLGNVNDMPKPGVLECHHWLKHKDLYGPISSVTAMGQTFIIINDPDIAFELLRDRAAIHSSRPCPVFSGDMVGFAGATAMIPYNDTWKIHRKIITQVASSNKSIAAFDRAQEIESAHFLLNVLDSPEKLFKHLQNEAGSVVLRITYGYIAAHGADPLVEVAAQTMLDFSVSTVPGMWMVDYLPFLRYVPGWLPGTGFKKTARQMAMRLKQCTDQPYEWVKQQMREKRHTTSFVSEFIENTSTETEMEFIHKWAAMSLFLAGVDTTSSSLMIFFLAMMVYPEVQKKASEEIDHVIGRSRLPVAADRDKLPYIMAMVKETHRWHLVLPLGFPHSNIEQDIYRGYRIPKGSILLPNNWHFTHDPEVYPDPMAFKPERHLDTPTHKAEPDPRKFIFGYGRRICPGRYVADNALFITIAQSLAVFDITKPTENGKIVEPNVEFKPGTFSHPLPYRCSIKPKSKEHEDLIRAAELEHPWEESDATGLESVKW